MLHSSLIFDFLAFNCMMLLIGFAIECLCGWPNRLFKSIGHPVSWIGLLISWCDSRWNSASKTTSHRRRTGLYTLILCVSVTGMAALIVTYALTYHIDIEAVEIFLAGLACWPFLAGRSLYSHVRAVYIPLEQKDIASARHAVSMIVGRDTTELEEAGICSAAIESLAENSSDGVVAPLFWGLIAGLPGLYIYKSINTLDSMIGYKSEKYIDFGRASAKCDDGVNFLPARLTGLIFCVCSFHPVRAIKIMFRDASQHVSPNAGWPESALAGSINVELGGPRHYAFGISEAAYINAGGEKANRQKLKQALNAYRSGLGMICLILAGIVLAIEA